MSKRAINRNRFEEDVLLATGKKLTVETIKAVDSDGLIFTDDGDVSKMTIADTANGLITLSGGTGGVRLDNTVGIGIAPSANVTNYISRAFTATSTAYGTKSVGLINGSPSNSFYGMSVENLFGAGASGNHGNVAQLNLSSPTVANNGASITNLATLLITGPPTFAGTVTNGPYAIFVDAGDVRFDDDLQVGGLVHINLDGGSYQTPLGGTALLVDRTGTAANNSYINIVSGNTGKAGIALGDSDDDAQATVDFNNNGRLLEMFNAGKGLSIASDGSSTFGGNIKIDQGAVGNDPRLTFDQDGLGANTWYIGVDRSDGDMDFITSSANKLKLASGANGLITLSGGTGGVRLDNTVGIGIAPDADWSMFIDTPARTITATQFAGGIYVNPDLTEASSGTHPNIDGIHIPQITITNNGATTTEASALYIANAPTGITPTNGPYAIFVDDGESRFDGKILAYGGIDLGGGLEAEADSGAISLFNMPVTSTPSAGDEMSASIMIDSEVVVKALAQADGTGGLLHKGLVAHAQDGAIPDAALNASEWTAYLDESGNTLTFKVCYADGTTYKTGTVALA